MPLAVYALDTHEELAMDRADRTNPNEETPRDESVPRADHATEHDKDENPPHTTTGKVTSPKFGSAGSGGAEFEPGPPRP
jgi:hypothetical protein